MATWKWYGNGLLNIAKGNVDLDADTFKCSLHTVSYAPDQDAHNYRDDLTNEVPNGSGYITGGVALASLAVTYDGASNEVRWDFADPSWATLTAAFQIAVISKIRGGAASADELVAYIDLGAQSITATTYTIVLDATGALKLTAAT